MLIMLVQNTTILLPLLTRSLTIVLDVKSFRSWMDFAGDNQINIRPDDQHKTTLICPWGIVTYRKLLFGLENVGETF